MYSVEQSFFKTVREIELEQKCADLERALIRQKYGSNTGIARGNRGGAAAMPAHPPPLQSLQIHDAIRLQHEIPHQRAEEAHRRVADLSL
jgi:hypothetical protein